MRVRSASCQLKTPAPATSITTMFLTHPSFAHPAIAHGFFGREGGVSEGIYRGLNVGIGSSDTRAHVLENRRRVADAFGQPAGALCTLHQVHSATVVVVEKPFPIDQRPEADAMVTSTPGVLLGILTADCAPILFADTQARVIGAAHAGWKGARAGVVEATVAAMEAKGARREHIRAVIGPCIAQQSYEVGPEFFVQFAAAEQAQHFVAAVRENHYQFNLPGYVLAQLARAGVTYAFDITCDTFADETRFFSYRRSTHRAEPDYGRQASTIMLQNS